MKKCSNCGKENDPTSSFCEDCGSALLSNVGNKIADRYEILGALEIGNFFTRYEAADTQQANKVHQILEIRMVSGFVKEAQKMLERENQKADLAKSLSNEYIGCFSGFYSDKDISWFVWETGGPSLSQMLSRNPNPLSIEQVVQWAMQVCRALQYLHSQGIIHRNICPGNITLQKGSANEKQPAGAIKLVNFDYACKIGTDLYIEPFALLGYSPPEQLEPFHKLDGRCDIYSLGVTMYQLLSRYEPRNNLHQVFTFPRLSKSNNKVPPNIERVIEKAMKLTIHERYQSAAEMLQDLSALNVGSLSLVMHSVGKTDVGRQREHNEDALLVSETFLQDTKGIKEVKVYAVADGMGGEEMGELASSMALQILENSTKTPLIDSTVSDGNITKKLGQKVATGRLGHKESDKEKIQNMLIRTIQTANEEIYQYAQKKLLSSQYMGTTLTAALIQGPNMYVANVGDSRTYIIRDGSIKQITVDHSLLQRLVDIGQITAEEAIQQRDREKSIYRSLGSQGQIEVDTFTETLEIGDSVLLCSDGLTDMVRDEEILNIVKASETEQEACERLIEAANDSGGTDNITVILLKVVATNWGPN